MWQWPSKRYSVLFVKYDRYLPEVYGGVETSTHGLCEKLTAQHHRASVASISPNSALEGCSLVDLGYSVYGARDLKTSVRRALSEFSPNVVVLQECGPQPWAMIRRTLRWLPLVFYQHSAFPGSHLYDNEEVRSRTNTRFIANSPFTAKLAESHGVQPVVVPPIFGMQRFVGQHRTGNKILMISVQPSKGADIALKLAQQRPEYEFLFVESWTEEPEETRRMGEAISKLGNATLLPSVRDMQPIYASSKLLLMPSRCAETWGRVATEAQLFGIPVVGSNRGRLPDTIGSGGAVLDPDDYEPWLRAVDRFMTDQNHYATVSAQARAHSQQLLRTVADKAEDDFLDALDSVTGLGQMLLVYVTGKLHSGV